MRGHLTFPNACRNYDATRAAVRFWGHDQSMEVSFFIGSDVLGRLEPAMRDDSEGCLNAFDSHRARISSVAANVYERRRSGSYDLLASDF